MTWSYSAIETWNVCPEQYAHKYVWKDMAKLPRGPEAEAGIALHEQYDTAVRERRPTSPMQTSILAAARGKELVTEKHLGITEGLHPCGFWDDFAWGRGIIDVGIIGEQSAWLGDWKTGKTREKPLQLEIFALFGVVHWPQVQAITTCNLWVNTGKPGVVRTFQRDDLPRLLAGILKPVMEIERAIEANAFPRRPGPLCGWCDALTCPLNPRKP